MKIAILAASLAALAATAAAGVQKDPVPADAAAEPAADAEDEEAARLRQEMDARWERLQAETAAIQAARREAQERYEREVREVEASRLQHEADLARHREETERAEQAQAEYEARMEAWRNDPAVAGAARRPERRERSEPVGRQAAAAQPTASCEQQSERNRERGRSIGGLIGGIAGSLGGLDGRTGRFAGLVANLLPVGELIGEAIAGMLDCDEQQKAAGATQEVVEQAERGGVGTTVDWESETRPGVRGSSTVTAMETASADGECMTVTDIVIVDGEETRAPKRMCRRPPSTRYVRV